jgi:2-keto-4-pentenoate hydratase/2-oxohepta-3-ene-1,7-dioic acid hydratase in catechol pathway
MKVASFIRPDGSDGFGIVVAGGVRDIEARKLGPWRTAAELAADQSARRDPDFSTSADFRLDEVTLLPPSPAPHRIVCVGLNYRAHILETGRETPSYPTLFARFADSLVGHGQHMVAPAASAAFDFEGELAVIIGRGGRHIREQDALQHVAGYTAFNDGSIRDYQYKTSQFLPGKCFWRSGAAGPFLVTPDEVGPLGDLQLQTRLNGEIVQVASVGDLLFDVERLIAELSALFPLYTGDVIATGTPGGVGVARNPQLFMRPGDTIEVEIGPIGTLRNTIVAETEA